MASAEEPPLRRVLLAGGTSVMGKVFIEELLQHPHGYEVGVLTRASSAPSGASKQAALDGLKAMGATVVEADYASADALAPSLQGWDAIVSVLGKEGLSQQEVLIAAAAKAGTRRFLPSEYGLDLSRVGAGAHPFYDRKLKVQQVLRASGVPWTVVSCGMFMETILARLRAGGKFMVCGSGDTPFTAMDWKDLGRLLGDVLADASTRNQAVVLTGASVTWNSVIADYQEVAGVPVDAVRVSSWLVLAKKAVTFDASASFPMSVGLLLDRGTGNLAGGWNTLPGRTGTAGASVMMTFKDFVAAQLRPSGNG